MTQIFELTEEEFNEIKAIAQDDTPVMKIGDHWTGMDKQQRANDFWKRLGEKHGFVWDSVVGVEGVGVRFYQATLTQPQHI